MLKIGDILGETYRIEQLLNRGGFGRVLTFKPSVVLKDQINKELTP
jgi:hypothetical protein